MRGSIIILALLVWPLTARAQSADELIEEGLTLREARRDAEALERFERAHAASPSGRALAQMALAEQALSRFVPAATHMRAALSSSDPWIAERRAVLEGALGQIEANVGQLAIVGAPDGAAILVDGAAVGTAPLEPLPLAIGTVQVEVRAEGHDTWRGAVVITAGGITEERLELTPAGGPPAEPAPSGGGMSPVGPIVLAVGGAMVITGVITGLLALWRDTSISDACGGFTSCDASVRPLVEERQTLAAVTDVMLFAGGAAAVTGLVLLFVLPGETSPDVALAPLVGPGLVGASVGGRL